jgi:hypothetical protein
VVAVEVGDEDDFDVAGINPEPVHVRKERRSAIEEHAAVHHDGPVVAVQRVRGSAAEKREPYAMVTAGFR